MNYQEDRALRSAERRKVTRAAIKLAKKATIDLSRRLRRAKVAGAVPSPFPRAALVAILRAAYRYQLEWRSDRFDGPVSRVLRELTDAWIDWRSGRFLILLRAALPEIDAKKCSKWAAALDAADYYDVAPEKLGRFLTKMGGIEGAARRRAELWRTVEDGDWAKRSLPQYRFTRLRPPGATGRSRSSARPAQRRQR